jgi:hypothetical protein
VKEAADFGAKKTIVMCTSPFHAARGHYSVYWALLHRRNLTWNPKAAIPNSLKEHALILFPSKDTRDVMATVTTKTIKVKPTGSQIHAMKRMSKALQTKKKTDKKISSTLLKMVVACQMISIHDPTVIPELSYVKVHPAPEC